MTSILTKIEAAKASLEQYAHEYDNDINKVEEFSKIAKDIAPNTNDADVIEIIFRGLLQKFLSLPSSLETLLLSNGNILSLIRFTLAFVPYVSSSSSSSSSSPTTTTSLSDTGLVAMVKMPYLLIEDLLDCLSIKNTESVWGIIETLIFDYTDKHPEFLARGIINIINIIVIIVIIIIIIIIIIITTTSSPSSSSYHHYHRYHDHIKAS